LKRPFIKIIGPPTLRAIRALEKIAVDTPEVCIMDSLILQDLPRDMGQYTSNPTTRGRVRSLYESEGLRDTIGRPSDRKVELFAMSYFGDSGISVPLERCEKIISQSGVALGDCEFFFEWFQNPTFKQYEELVQKIDIALEKLGCLYTLVNK